MSKEELKKNDSVDVSEETSSDTAVTEVTEEVEETSINESFVSLFEGAELTEDFKAKATLVFEAAVNEGVAVKTAAKLEEMETKINSIDEQIEAAKTTLAEEFENKLNEAVETHKSEISEDVDSYMDYVVEKWVEENALAIDSGIRLERAEAFIEGVKALFIEQNVNITEETVDVVGGLETELAEANEAINAALNENIALKAEIEAFKAGKVFEDVCEGLTDTQKDRMKTLSEKLDHSDLEAYASDLGTLKETFFKEKTKVVSEEMEQIEEKEEIKEEVKSDYDSVNALASALTARANREK